MNKRQRKYLQKRKAFKKRQNTGFEFTSFSIPVYDMDKKIPVDDEPNYFSNFAMMMPTKAIKMPTKKELKKQWYDNPRARRLINISPVTSGMAKPWQKNKFKWLNHTSMIQEIKPWVDKCSDAYRKIQSMMGIPENRQVGGFNCPPPPPEDQTLFGYSHKVLPLEMKFETPELEEKYKNSAFMIQYDNEGRPIDSVHLKNIQDGDNSNSL